MYLERRISYN